MRWVLGEAEKALVLTHDNPDPDAIASAARRPSGAMRFQDRMSDADALMWHIEADPTLRSTILSTWILDRTPDLSRFEAKAERATRLIPRLRQRVRPSPANLAISSPSRPATSPAPGRG